MIAAMPEVDRGNRHRPKPSALFVRALRAFA
jgi:hypothetical protein